MRKAQLMKARFSSSDSVGSRNSEPRRGGWTLIELMVVIVIVVILAAAVFALLERGLAAARSAACVSNVKQLGCALLEHAADHNDKFLPLQPAKNPDTGKRPPIWTVQLAREGYLSNWDGKGSAPCGTGVWTCPDCDFMSPAYGGHGVVEGAVFAYEENQPFGSGESGSLRLSKIANPSRTWLVGDASQKIDQPNRGWYAIWSQSDRWKGHGPVERHTGKVNVCLMDGSVVSLSRKNIEDRGLTGNVLKR